MARISDGQKIILALVLLLLAAGYFIVTASVDPESGPWNPTDESTSDVPPSGTDESGEPSKENVNHSYFQNVQSLKMKIASDPSDTTSIRQLGRLFQDAHQSAESAELYENYIKQSPMVKQVWLDLTTVYAQTGDWKMAESTMVRSIDYFPDDPAIQYNMGAIFANQSDFENARTWWKKVADQNNETELRDRAISSLGQISTGQD
jgi:tetratricopeptide (TPR) repeat protein